MYLDKTKCANGYLSEAEALGSSPSRKVKSWQKKKKRIKQMYLSINFHLIS